ncbi:signal peptidase II [Millionella massiliensis]|uniref:signal peptidase II n=1 Tax=Millionella massiliensis TaxID=1871023 RepID=UPI0008D9A030|nr:signal peptidase II [Millionella massiliensis]
MKKCNTILWVILLILLDQAVKLIIYHLFMESNYSFVPNLLEFKPIFNPSHSYWTAKLGANLGVVAHLSMFSFIWAILIIFYKFYHKVDPKNKLLDTALIFQTAGFASAYISIIFWKDGVLDFIYLKPLNIVCDLKDLYINIFIALWIIGTSIIAVKHHTSFKDMIQYIKALFKKG